VFPEHCTSHLDLTPSSGPCPGDGCTRQLQRRGGARAGNGCARRPQWRGGGGNRGDGGGDNGDDGDDDDDDDGGGSDADDDGGDNDDDVSNDDHNGGNGGGGCYTATAAGTDTDKSTINQKWQLTTGADGPEVAVEAMASGAHGFHVTCM